MAGRKFSQAKLNKFKETFIERIKEITASILKNANQELDVEGDEVDLIQGNVIHELTTKLSQRDMLKIKKLQIAIERINSGTFGKCTECEDAIGEKRLLAMPGCDLCITCAEQEELDAKEFAL